MDQLREFLARVLPWPDEDQSHFCNLHWRVEANGRAFWSGRACRDVENMVRTLRWAEKFPDTRDIYVCMSAQAKAEPKVSKAGHQYLAAIRNQDNAVALKSLFLDIDCKDGDKGYPDQMTAVTALLHFCSETGLPRPTLVVSSGGGVHAHWVLDRALSLADWQPLADALAEATRQNDLKCDTQCTVDGARILRPPLAKNFKFDPPKETRLIGSAVEHDYPVGKLREALAPYITARVTPSQGLTLEGEPPAALQGVEAPDVVSDLTGARLVELDLVAPECPFLKEAIDTGGAGFQQPLWHLTTLIATFTQGQREDAHRMAMGHEDYQEETTDALYDRKLKDKQDKDLGWPSCGAILNAGCSACRKCPHLKEGKSPLNFEKRPVFIPKPNPIHLPKNYFVNSDGHICTYRADDEGNKTEFALIDYPVTDAWAQKDPWVLHFSAELHDDQKSRVELQFGHMSSTDTIVKALSEQGLVVSPFVTKHLREFFVSWVRTLQARKDSVVDSAPYGWNTSNGQVDGFCFGGEVWTPNGSRPAPNVDHVLRRQYAPTGSRDPWDEALKLVTGQGRPELEAIVASAFAGPLVKATGWYGAFLSAYSQESGIGKTTAMKIAQAVWGDPTTAMQGLDDTLNSVTHKIGAIRSLPLYWDEIKGDENTRKFVKLAFQMTSGKDKSRLGRDVQLREVGKWQTMLISATNESLIDYIAEMTSGTTAGVYRLFEFPVAKRERTVDTGEAQRMLGRLDENYGVVGYEYAQWLGRNFARIDVEIGEYMKRIEKSWGFQQDERFWQCAITCVVMGARYANELGFAQFDVDAIEAFMRKTLDEMRKSLKDSTVDLSNPDNVCDVLTQFFKAMKKHTLITNKINQGAGRPKRLTVLKIHPNHDGTHVQIGKDDMTIRISSKHLSTWLGKNTNVSRNVLTREFERRWGARKVLGHLGSGTDYAEGKEWLLEIDANGTPLAQFINEAETDDGEKSAKSDKSDKSDKSV